jgi:hypothetical protein
MNPEATHEFSVDFTNDLKVWIESLVTQHLPFGCHAWKKYEYESFWKQYIK